MKKFILLVCFLLVSSLSQSQLLTENFDYSTGTALTANTWTQISTVATNPILVSNPGLTYTDYLGSGIGNAATLVNSGQDVFKDLTSSQTSGSVYASMMVNVITGRTGDYFATFIQAGSETSFYGRLFVKLATNGNLAFGISKFSISTSIPAVYSDSIYSTGTTYLIVVKYTFNTGTGTDDEASLFVFSGAVPSTEPVPTVGPVTTTQADATTLGRFALRQGGTASAPNVIVDGIYVETSWNNNVLPVELSSFTSVINKRDVTLNWATSAETNNSGFEIERSNVIGQTSNEWIKTGNVTGNGTTSIGHSYSFTDRNLASGNYSYRLKQIDYNGNFEYFNLNNEVNIGIPVEFDLSQNYPNPFNPSTTINFDLPTDGKVSVKLFDMSGKEIAVLVNEVKTAGYYSVNFNASSLSSGVYFYNITADNFTATKKMMLVK